MSDPASTSDQEETLAGHIKKYLDARKTSSYSPSTLEGKESRLRFFERFFSALDLGQIEELERKHLPPFIDYVRNLRSKRSGEKLKPITVFGIVLELKYFLEHLHREEVLSVDLASCIEIRMEDRPLPRVILTEAEAEKLLSLPDQGEATGLRDRAILELMYGAGLRLGETANLDLYDLDFEEKSIFIRNGKGKKDRLVPIGPALEATLQNYIQKARPKLIRRLRGETFLFPNSARKKIQKYTVGALVSEYFRLAGFKGSAHSLRHSFATHLLKNGANLLYIQRLLGHKDIGTTTVYTRVYPKELREAVLAKHPRSLYPTPRLEMPIRVRSVKFPYLMKLKAQDKVLDPAFYTYEKLSQRMPAGYNF